MSARKRRAAFDPNALSDLDDLLPPLNLVREPAAGGSKTEGSAVDVLGPATTPSEQGRSDGEADAAPPVEAPGGTVAESAPSELREADRSQTPTITPETSPGSVDESNPSESNPTESARLETDKQTSSRRVDARRKVAKRDASANSSRVAPPEVALPEEIYSALRALTLAERSADPTTARSYGQVVLDAVEQHADDLKTRWTHAVPVSGTGLFRRAEVGRPTRRRHSAPRARVPLAGVINTDAAVLDQLASDWGAGSRSALVEEALRLYLEVE
jgi:hypothetical protein